MKRLPQIAGSAIVTLAVVAAALFASDPNSPPPSGGDLCRYTADAGLSVLCDVCPNKRPGIDIDNCRRVIWHQGKLWNNLRDRCEECEPTAQP
jgi:hypothetical protein